MQKLHWVKDEAFEPRKGAYQIFIRRVYITKKGGYLQPLGVTKFTLFRDGREIKIRI
jgi:hypothetical protein